MTWDVATEVGFATSPSGQKRVSKITRTVGYYVWDANANNPAPTYSYTLNKWKAIAAHEFGHAAGYGGHDTTATSSAKALMYPATNIYYDSWGIMAPTARDGAHMRNVY
ncbi:M10 family metallopeptidase domain-containing protein [Paenibacillus swuensis]|uniref:hypothetical protein n=1 Tax=Paenibacillus swuensis TaxID=1178515 RepID=UPI0018D445A2|nr:hypothetical protein [Paenibacillus swuensis]